MAPVDYVLDETVALVTLNSGENRFNPEFLSAFLGALDAVEQTTDARTLVVRSAHEKIFSNGIDLEWLAPVIRKGDREAAKAFFLQLNALFARLVSYPLLTVAAITGHAFAGGAILACAFDFRFMRSDRGFFCLPEVDLGIPFLPGMNALLKKAIPRHLLEEMQFTGKRYTAEALEAHHVILKACHQRELMDEVTAFARGLNKRRDVVAELKKRLNRPILDAIESEDAPYIASGNYNIG
jgi:enoyl-CoA hydratase/carnithine racemase